MISNLQIHNNSQAQAIPLKLSRLTLKFLSLEMQTAYHLSHLNLERMCHAWMDISRQERAHLISILARLKTLGSGDSANLVFGPDLFLSFKKYATVIVQGKQCYRQFVISKKDSLM